MGCAQILKSKNSGLWMYIKYVFVLSGMLLLVNSCFAEKPAGFVIAGVDGKSCPLYTRSNELSGVFSLSKTKRYDYSLDQFLTVPRNHSLEVDYTLRGLQEASTGEAAGSGYQIVLKIDDDHGWTLPVDLSYLAIDNSMSRIRYAVPLRTTRIKKISFELKGVAKSGNAPAVLLWTPDGCRRPRSVCRLCKWN